MNIRPALRNHYTLGSVAGLQFSITYLWFIVAAIFIYSFAQPTAIEQYSTLASAIPGISITTPVFNSSITRLTFAVFAVGSVYTSIILHELGHVYGAQTQSIDVQGIKLWTLGGAAQMTDQPESPRQEFILTIAGPLVTAIITITGVGFILLTRPVQNEILTTYLVLITAINAGILILNLVPAFPLDGGRLLRSGLAAYFGHERGTQYASYVAKIIASTFGVIALYQREFLMLILAFFVYFSANNEANRVKTAPHDVIIKEGTPVTLTATSSNMDFKQTIPDSPTHSHGPVEGTVSGEPPHTIDLPLTTFALDTEPDHYTLAGASKLLHRMGSELDLRITDNADYIIVPDGDSHLYSGLAKQHGSSIITQSAMIQLLNCIDPSNSRGEIPSRSSSETQMNPTDTSHSDRNNTDTPL